MQGKDVANGLAADAADLVWLAVVLVRLPVVGVAHATGTVMTFLFRHRPLHC
jgi:hypothetical protein